MVVLGMVLFVLLEALKLALEVTHFAEISGSACCLDLTLVLLDVLVDGFHGIAGCAGPDHRLHHTGTRPAAEALCRAADLNRCGQAEGAGFFEGLSMPRIKWRRGLSFDTVWDWKQCAPGGLVGPRFGSTQAACEAEEHRQPPA